MNRRTRAATVVAALLYLACGQAKPHEKLIDVGEYQLVDHDGRVFRSQSLKGTPALLFFGYTHCPDACPTMMAKVARAYREAGPKAQNIPTLFVSVDPRDTPAILKQYLGYFRAVPAKGLTGSKAQIDAVVKQYGAKYEIRDSGSAAGPIVDHTVRLYLLDRDGDVIQLFDPDADPKVIADAMKSV
ncbi:MAG TPA: SCO family protein [Thermoanaerobaculia bacterium]|jgi:protein SCO1/2